MSNPYVTSAVVCAHCGKQKGETNHWFLVTFIAAGLSGMADAAFYCRNFAADDIQVNELPVCGQGCAQKKFEEWMTAERNK